MKTILILIGYCYFDNLILLLDFTKSKQYHTRISHYFHITLKKDITYKSSSDKTFQFPILVQNNSNITVSNHQIQDKIAYATSLCLATGLWQIILSIFKFGKLSWLMSEIILSAFVTAAAFHILTSQLKSMFGIIIQRSPKVFGILYVRFQ